MWKMTLACALAAGLLGASLPANLAMAQAPGAATAKALSPQRQKMKDCAAKWNEEKASTGAKGRAAYNKFMRECLKKTAA